MSTLQLLATLAIWYLPGALAARWMIHRGHEPLAWVYAAWIGGALALVAALIWFLFTRPPGDPPGTGTTHAIPERTSP